MIKEKMIKEAEKRMNLLNILPQTIKAFTERGIIHRSEVNGIMFELSDEELEKVRNFEKSYDSLVYHVIKGSYIMSDGSIMECMDMLYVSEDEYEWSLDRKDIKKDKCTYVYAVSNFCDGEFGMLKVIPVNGGIIRDTHGF